MSKRKLLLADDSVTIQKVVNLTFADEGIEVISVGDGDSAMEKVAEISPDLIMADVNMPGLNGYQICEQIRQDEKLRQTPVILLVGSFEPFDEDEAKRVGADDFLTKPFQSIRQLVNKVTILLNSTAETVSDNYQIANATSSFADTLEMETPPMATPTEPIPQYTDAGFDDEMIQTDQVSNQVSTFALDESYKFETKNEISSQDDFSKTQSLTADEIKEFGLADTAWEISDEVVSESETLVENEIGYPASADEETKEFSFVANEEKVESEVEETFSESNFIKHNIEETFSESNIEETSSESSLENTTIVENQFETDSTKSDEIAFASSNLAETSEINEVLNSVETKEVETENEEIEIQEEIPLPEVASVLETDEGDLLELPPIEFDSDYEAESNNETESTAVETTEEISQTVQSQTTDTLSISAELIEAIANRVMEKLSDKAVKEVAWEVVPQMTELIVKKMAEEKLKE